MMETKGLSHEVTDHCLDYSDGLLSWEEFYDSGNEDLVESFLEMYDLLIGRSSEIKEDLINSQRQIGFEKSQTSLEERLETKDVNKEASLDTKKSNADNWCDVIKENWNCRCIEKSAIEPITRCAACDSKESKICSTDIRENPISKSETFRNINSNCQSEPSLSVFQDRSLSKCELVTCPAGFSTPSTPVQERFKRLVNQLPLSFKRSENYFRWVVRPSSVSSLASSSSSSSGASSCYGTKRLRVPNKSSSHLASIESLEGVSDIDKEDQKDKSSRFSKETGGSEDSGVHSLCTSLPLDKPKYCDPHLSYMDKVVTEIIETEEVYVGDLRKIIETESNDNNGASGLRRRKEPDSLKFPLELTGRCKLYDGLSNPLEQLQSIHIKLKNYSEGYLMKWRSLPDFPLSSRLDILFGNIETVFNFNSLFLKELKLCGLDPVKVARCFVKNNAGFSVYTEYCTNYPTTVSLLTELMRQEGIVRLFRERQAALQHTLPLGSYLLKPVQRILKYHLLLQNIVKQYSNGIEGHKDIVDALRTMTEIAQHINDMKRRHEHEVRVQEIQSLLLGWEGEDLTTFGELCAEGAFRMYGAKALRHVFLFDKMLLITKKKEGGILDYKTHINCSNLMLIESVPGEPLSFHVIPFDNPRLQYTLQCRNLEQKREWTWQIKRVILENYNAVIPSHARQLVMELGQSKSEGCSKNDVQTNKILPKRHHLAPEYLEKRKQEKGKTDSSFKTRVRRIKKLESGNKLEDQFKKSISTEEQSNLHSTENETEVTQLMEEKKANPDPPEKLEMKTLEQIITQILKQNREFDKVLKRQKHIIARSQDLSSRRKRKKEANSRGGKFVHDTLRNLNFLRAAQQEVLDTPKQNDGSVTSDCDTLLSEYQGCNSNVEDGIMEEKDVKSLLFDQPDTPAKITGDFQNVSLDEGIPTSPSVWLRQQVQHLPVAPKKAGSLPRSFQITSEYSQSDSRFFRDFRVSIERPFTIASDKITSTMLFEGMERFYKGQFRRSNSSTTEDGSLTDGLRTPGASLDHINIHPEYKIYRPGLSANIIKSMLSSMHNKLSHIKLDVAQKPEKKVLIRERKASRVIYLLAKHYHKTLRNKQKMKSFENDSDSCNQLVLSSASLPVYKQGSESLGARLANFSESECRINRLRCSKKAAALLGVYADSVISLQPTLKNNLGNNSAIKSSCTKENIPKDQTSAVDFFYERQFEKMNEELSSNLRLEDRDRKKIVGSAPSEQASSMQVKPNKERVIEKITKSSSDNTNPISERKKKEQEEINFSEATVIQQNKV